MIFRIIKQQNHFLYLDVTSIPMYSLWMFLALLTSYPSTCLSQRGSTGLENLKIIDSLLRNYDRRATPTNTLGENYNMVPFKHSRMFPNRLTRLTPPSKRN